MTESTPETVPAAWRGVLTDCRGEELGAHIAVTMAQLGPGTNSPTRQCIQRRWARAVLSKGATELHQLRRRGRPRWRLHTVPAQLITRSPPRRRPKHDLPHPSHKPRREAAHVRTNTALPDEASAPIGNQ